MAGSIITIFAAPANAQNFPEAPIKNCDLHVWPTSNYGGVFFHADNFRSEGLGTRMDLVMSPVETAAQKAHAAFGSSQQKSILVESIKASGKFSAYNIIVHDPLPPDQATKYASLMESSVGAGGREIPLSSICYAELHVGYITVFRTHLTKMLMTGFLLRYFDRSSPYDLVKVIHSRPQRGEERISLSNFDFSTAAFTEKESGALTEAFRFMTDRFLKKKVKP